MVEYYLQPTVLIADYCYLLILRLDLYFYMSFIYKDYKQAHTHIYCCSPAHLYFDPG